MHARCYDLHTHSTASDGTLNPTKLVQSARAAGVDVLALTDHDTTAGLAEARQVSRECGLDLIPGVEVSVTWGGRTIHVVGLRVDPESDQLQQGLAGLRAFREWRAEEIGRRLAKHGIKDALAGARRLARGALVSRSHFARFLVEQGMARNVRDVFRRFLVPNKPGHVAGQWASLGDAVGWIRTAGGEAVVAHPARYDFSRTKLRSLLQDFVDCDGVGLEVVSGSHSRDDIRVMAAHARSFGLLASAGSDYHGPEQSSWVRLGTLPELPEGCNPIWEAWDL